MYHIPSLNNLYQAWINQSPRHINAHVVRHSGTVPSIIAHKLSCLTNRCDSCSCFMVLIWQPVGTLSWSACSNCCVLLCFQLCIMYLSALTVVLQNIKPLLAIAHSTTCVSQRSAPLPHSALQQWESMQTAKLASAASCTMRSSCAGHDEDRNNGS